MRFAILFVLAVLQASHLNAQNEIDALRLQASREINHGDYAQAQSHLTSALEKATSNQDSMRAYFCEQQLARLAENQKDLPKAEEWLLTSLHTLENGSNKPSPLPALEGLDSFYERHSMNDKAIPVLQRMIEMWSKAAGPESLVAARYQYRLGSVLDRNENPADAEQPLRSALAVFQKSGAIYTEAADHAKRQLIRSLSEEGKIQEVEALKATLAPRPAPREKPDTTPQLLSKIEPKYSEGASKLKLSGTIVLSLDVNEKGEPENLQVLEPLGEGLDENAIEAVKSWRFRPATKGGVPVAMHAQVEVSFRIL